MLREINYRELREGHIWKRYILVGNLKNMNDNADTIETAELDKVVADVLNYDNMMNVDMYIDGCLKGKI